MLTQQMPALVNALSKALPQNVIAQITQALGNCNQPITHRAGVNVQPSIASRQSAALNNDVWNPAVFQPILPTVGQITEIITRGPGVPGPPGAPGIVVIPGYEPGSSGNNYGGSAFNFPVTNEFNINDIYGGPTTYIGGNSAMVALTTTNFTAGNAVITFMNGEPAPGTPGERGPSGPPGTPGGAGNAGPGGQDGAIGRAGREGSPGRPGSPGASGLPGGRGANGVNGINGRNGRDGRNGFGFPGPPGRPGRDGEGFSPNPRSAPFLRATALRATGTLGTGSITIPTTGSGTISVPTYTFDPESCTITQSGSTSVSVTVSLSGGSPIDVVTESQVDLSVGPIRPENALISV